MLRRSKTKTKNLNNNNKCLWLGIFPMIWESSYYFLYTLRAAFITKMSFYMKENKARSYPGPAWEEAACREPCGSSSWSEWDVLDWCGADRPGLGRTGKTAGNSPVVQGKEQLHLFVLQADGYAWLHMEGICIANRSGSIGAVWERGLLLLDKQGVAVRSGWHVVWARRELEWAALFWHNCNGLSCAAVCR